MKIDNFGGVTNVMGKVSEKEQILVWIEAAKKYERTLEIVVDECDEYGTSYAVVGLNLTQAERTEAFRMAKKDLKDKKY